MISHADNSGKDESLAVKGNELHVKAGAAVKLMFVPLVA